MLRNAPSRSRQLQRNVFNRRLNANLYRRALIPGARYTNLLIPPRRIQCVKSCFHTQSEAAHGFVDDTIYALSTAHGKAGIAIIRISGSACLDV